MLRIFAFMSQKQAKLAISPRLRENSDILAKIHVADGRKMVAVCDSGLLGKKFEENDLQIDLTGSFYRGKGADELELRMLLKDSYVADFVGEKAVDFGIKEGVVKRENVKVVSGVPRAQFFAI